MSPNYPLSKLTLALLTLPVASLTHAAGIDRSGQDIKGFFNEGTYAEIDFAYIDTNISGYDNGANQYGITTDSKDYVKGNPTGNVTDDAYTFIRYGVKTEVNDNVNIGLFYDEPYGAEAEYEGDSTFVSKPGTTSLMTADFKLPTDVINPATVNDPDYDKNTNVRLHTESWTGLIGYKTDSGLEVFGGPVVQKAEAEVHLRGQAYGPLTGYDANSNHDTSMGWVAGIGYSKPEIALKANLTYRSEIDHETELSENMPALGNSLIKNTYVTKYNNNFPDKPLTDEIVANISPNAITKATVTTPESVNFNFQTGISAKHQLLATLDVRWVPWSDTEIVLPLYNSYSKGSYKDGLALLDYEEDQWKVDVGIAKRFNDKLAGSVVVGWDSGAGDPASSLGTVDGYYSIGGGFKYNLTPEWSVSAGGKYLKFGDAIGELPSGNVVSKFEDNDGYIAGVKLSYQSI